jgi:hypothetical protein
LAFIDLKNKVVQAKIVYYGPGRGGKTTNLEYIFNKFRQRVKTDLVSIKTEGDRTLYFDFLPFDVGLIKGFEVKMQLYTVPGQVKYDSTRRLVLRGVDGLVFVADSSANRRHKNIESLKNLHKNLGTYNKSIFQVPLVLQYNKRDLAEQGVPLMSVAAMDKTLNAKLKVPSYPASAVTGYNIVETLKKAIYVTMLSLQSELN